MPSNKHIPLTVGSLALAGLFLAGCGKSEPEYVEVREIQQTPEDPHAGHNHAPGEHGMAAESPHAAPTLAFEYEIPEGWVAQPPSSMKLLSLVAGQPPELLSELSVSAFPGDVGGQLANINRWRQQVGLGPISPEAVDGFIENMLVSGKAAWQVDFTGPAGTGANGGSARIVVTALEHDGQTWFFKLMGNDSSVEEELANYSAFLQSVKF